MSLDLLLKDQGFIRNYDVYSPEASPNASNRVHIYCKGKKRHIWGVLSEGFDINVKSKWQSLFGSIGGDIGAKVLDVVDNVEQLTFGRSIRQPYFGRKYWQGTDPLALSLCFQFVSFIDAKKEVYDPMISLLSLIYPRIDSDSPEKETLAGVFSQYFIPGPTPFYGSEHRFADLGDRVEISMGSFLRFSACYITGLSAYVENSFSIDGFPNCIKVNMSFETLDACYTDKNGNFMEQGFRDNSVSLGKSLEKLVDAGINLFDSVKDKLAKKAEERKVKQQNASSPPGGMPFDVFQKLPNKS